MGSFSGLLNNAALMLVFCVIYDILGVYEILNKNLRDYLTGILVGLICIAVMLNPWSIQPGVFFDTRWVILSLSGLFFGFIPTAFAVIIAGAFRLYQGGPGGIVGTVVIVVTACVGLAWRYWKEKYDKPLGWKQLYAFGVLVQLAMLSCIFLMPADMRIPIFKSVAPPILIVFPVLTMFIGLILKKQGDRRQVHEELHQYEKILSTSSDMMAYLDKQYRYITANKAYLQAFNLTNEELVGKKAADVLGEDFFHTNVKPYADRCLGGEEVNFQNWTNFPSKEQRYVDVTYYPYYGVDGKITGYVVNGRDITERKNAEAEKEALEAQLRQSQKMEAVGTLAGGIAHDFNNILSIILGYAELIKSDSANTSLVQEGITQVQKAADRAKHLVKQILSFSRKEKKELIPIRPQSLIKETLKLLRSTTPTTVSIIHNISQDCCMIMADPTQLHQLLMNIFTNAVYAIDEKGEVAVSLEDIILRNGDFDQFSIQTLQAPKTPGKYVKLSVKDSGAGMDTKTLDRIFDPFYTNKEVGKGTGMGLSVVHGIVESHGGFINVESELGRGSTFNVFIPVANVKEDEFPEVETTTHSLKGEERILLVDDEEMILNMAEQMLKSQDYKVTTESSSVKALAVFKSKPDQFDLVITDQSMPDMAGSELVAEILKERPDMPVILCTGYSTKVSEENARERGISKYMTKPYSQKELSEAIRNVLNGKV